MSGIRPGWVPRRDPLRPVAVVAEGVAAVALEARVAGAGWRGVRGEGVLLLSGPAESLPWVDGCVYLGRDVEAPGLLLPTQLTPDVPLELFARALRRVEGEGEWAVWPDARLALAHEGPLAKVSP